MQFGIDFCDFALQLALSLRAAIVDLVEAMNLVLVTLTRLLNFVFNWQELLIVLRLENSVTVQSLFAFSSCVHNELNQLLVGHLAEFFLHRLNSLLIHNNLNVKFASQYAAHQGAARI